MIIFKDSPPYPVVVVLFSSHSCMSHSSSSVTWPHSSPMRLLLALVLLLSPGPQVTEHSAQGLQVSGTHSRGQAASSHFLTSVPFPAHWPPSIRGSRRIFLVRDWLPTPQVTEQSDQSENPDQRQSLPAKINFQKIIGAERFSQD